MGCARAQDMDIDIDQELEIELGLGLGQKPQIPFYLKTTILSNQVSSTLGIEPVLR